MIENPQILDKKAEMGKRLTIILSILYAAFEIWITVVEAINAGSMDVKSLIMGIIMLAVMIGVVLFGLRFFVAIVGIRFLLNVILFVLTIGVILNNNTYYISDVLCFSFGAFVSFYGTYLMFFSGYVKEYYKKLRSTRKSF